MIVRSPAVLLAAAALAALGGCVFDGTLVEGERSIRLDHVPLSPVDVETGNGSVSIERADGTVVVILATIRARTTDRLDATEVSATRGDDGTLVVRTLWPGRRRGNESCSFEIALPDAVGVKVVTDNGAVRVAGLSGPADLRSDNGAIELLDHDGAVAAETDNGRITVRRTPHPIHAETDNGAIELDGVSAPVHAKTDNGLVEITLTDDASGPVDVKTDNGAVTLIVGSGFAGKILATTDNGPITGESPDIRRTSPGKHRAEFDFGPGEPSRIETDNGSITIRRK